MEFDKQKATDQAFEVFWGLQKLESLIQAINLVCIDQATRKHEAPEVDLPCLMETAKDQLRGVLRQAEEAEHYIRTAKLQTSTRIKEQEDGELAKEIERCVRSFS